MNASVERIEEIRGIIAQIVQAEGRQRAFAPNDNLRDAGVTSLQLVNIMLAVEDRFELTFPQSKLTPQNFQSAAAIEALVASLTERT